MEYSIALVVKPFDDPDLEDELLGELEVTITRQAGLVVAEQLVEAQDGIQAARKLIRELRRHGIWPVRPLPDLVNMATIASRARVSRPAVTKWVNESSKKHFPAPYATGSGCLWLWQEVNEWLRAEGHHHDSWEQLRRTDMVQIEVELLEMTGASAGGTPS